MAQDVLSSSFFPFPSARTLHAHSSLWANSASTDWRATKVWAAKLTCRNISDKLFRAQHYPGVYGNKGEHVPLIPPATLSEGMKTTRARVFEGRRKRKKKEKGKNTNSAKLLCMVPDDQRGWTQDQYSTCTETGVKCHRFRRLVWN